MIIERMNLITRQMEELDRGFYLYMEYNKNRDKFLKWIETERKKAEKELEEARKKADNNSKKEDKKKEGK